VAAVGACRGRTERKRCGNFAPPASIFDNIRYDPSSVAAFARGAQPLVCLSGRPGVRFPDPAAAGARFEEDADATGGASCGCRD
jgi:hypothetical protein